MNNPDRHIDEILDEFDFVRVHDVMEYLDWTWEDGNVPAIPDLRRKARSLLRTAAKLNENEFVNTGGFEATNCGTHLHLAFMLTDFDSGHLAYKDEVA